MVLYHTNEHSHFLMVDGVVNCTSAKSFNGLYESLCLPDIVKPMQRYHNSFLSRIGKRVITEIVMI